MKRLVLFILLFNASIINAQDMPSSIIADYHRIARLVKFDSIKVLASLVEYPLGRENPMPDINTAKEFISYYDTLFDNEFKKKVIDLKDSDIFQHEENYGLFAGDIWTNEMGKSFR